MWACFTQMVKRPSANAWMCSYNKCTRIRWILQCLMRNNRGALGSLGKAPNCKLCVKQAKNMEHSQRTTSRKWRFPKNGHIILSLQPFQEDQIFQNGKQWKIASRNAECFRNFGHICCLGANGRGGFRSPKIGPNPPTLITLHIHTVLFVNVY